VIGSRLNGIHRIPTITTTTASTTAIVRPTPILLAALLPGFSLDSFFATRKPL